MWEKVSGVVKGLTGKEGKTGLSGGGADIKGEGVGRFYIRETWAKEGGKGRVKRPYRGFL